ncbi:PIN domain-containing protein [Yersinia enterocolitica]|uniref:type II toxin-antitoxin system VapC family toxin n=1 Tax=Yersinia enterocolitica TaxID=630 RepID=UPI00028198A0|nr:type II toxin-antitoxin system VapC family toxin [Yersinia enterocolitica]EKA25820.1 virulence associated protein C [Yersinia enterocolitica subsp. enterocolitica WA-314]PNM12808.1 PIN domain-containing protein [Yersinia enterocolitica]CNJ15892.1 virulence associated protein C [Yersinia enterocolitica]VFT01381.1 PilT domain-containing protein [Yersinia enterocolitica]VTP85087.1 virulence associated protein C [Yersinia enterocolitica subsp. enterocolitica]
MIKKLYMLDTNICSFIMRERPAELIIKLQQCIEHQNKIVVSAITYSEMRFGAIGKKASPNHNYLVDESVKRLDAILPWDTAAVNATTNIKVELAKQGTSIGGNDAAIAGHAISVGAILVTNNIGEFERVKKLRIEDRTL